MKNFLRRLKFYGFGFGIGLIFVFFFFQNRGCTWLPSNRVKNTILGRVIVLNDADRDGFKAKGITQAEVVEFLNSGDVAFGKSKKHGDPQVYSISKDVNGKETELWFTLPKDGFISEVRLPKGTIFAAGNSKEGIGVMIHFPNVKNIVYLDTNRLLTCQQEHLGLLAPRDVMKCLKNSGQIDFSRAKFHAEPYPKQLIRFRTKKGVFVETETYWYQEHIQISEFILEDPLDCAGY